MRKSVFLLLISAMLIMLCITCSQEEILTLSKVKTGRVTGTVFDKETGNPRAGVTVSISGGNVRSYSTDCGYDSSTGGTSASYVTGSDGMYIFDNVLPSTYTYTSESKDCTTTVRHNYSISVKEGTIQKISQSITVITDKTVTADLSY